MDKTLEPQHKYFLARNPPPTPPQLGTPRSSPPLLQTPPTAPSTSLPIFPTAGSLSLPTPSATARKSCKSCPTQDLPRAAIPSKFTDTASAASPQNSLSPLAGQWPPCKPRKT